MNLKLAGLIILFSVSVLAAEVPMHVANTPAPQSDPERPEWKERVENLTALGTQNPAAPLVFLGDSITEMWNADDAGKKVWAKNWAPLKALNFGIAGDRTEHVLWRLDHGNLDGAHPKLIVLLIGTNNAGQSAETPGYKCSPQQTAEGIQAILQRLKTKCPGSKVLLLAVFPRGEEDADPLRKQNTAVNVIIKTYADGQRVHFLDIGSKFLKPNGDGNIVIQPDMLHLSESGYEIFAREIKPKVDELMK